MLNSSYIAEWSATELNLESPRYLEWSATELNLEPPRYLERLVVPFPAAAVVLAFDFAFDSPATLVLRLGPESENSLPKIWNKTEKIIFTGERFLMHLLHSIRIHRNPKLFFYLWIHRNLKLSIGFTETWNPGIDARKDESSGGLARLLRGSYSSSNESSTTFNFTGFFSRVPDMTSLQDLALDPLISSIESCSFWAKRKMKC